MQSSVTGVASPARPASELRRGPAGWPVFLLFGLVPLWWALGLGALIWIILAVPMLVTLVQIRGVRLPRGFGLWLAFLAWMLVSASQLPGGTASPLAFGYRASLYLSMTVLFLYVYNLPRAGVPARRVVLSLTLFWAAVVSFGFLALVLPDGRITTPTALLLPSRITDNPFVQDLLNPRLAQVQTFLGYPVARPAAPFTYTNEWGGTIAMLTPMAIASLGLIRSYLVRNLVRLLLVASLVPMVISLDRGLWVGLGFGLVYAAVLVALRGNVRALLAILAFLALVGGLVALTPLKGFVEDRLAHPHSNARRESLGSAALQSWKGSPLFGYGGTLQSDNPNSPDVGTHGQVYLVLVSHGLPGVLFFVGWFLWAVWVTARGASGLPLWAHVVLVIGVLEFFFYDMLPTQLCLMMAVGALAMRELGAARARAAAPAAAPTAAG
ncbi:MAG TPA: O-antigen ligase family protein [Actinomycetes bacterium]|nr:O-antigen ligase family protein [Actinomycetes bacterium]